VAQDVAKGVSEGALEVAFQRGRRQITPRLKLPTSRRFRVADGPDLFPALSHARHDDRFVDERPR
jgi:hypothetical protein